MKGTHFLCLLLVTIAFASSSVRGSSIVSLNEEVWEEEVATKEGVWVVYASGADTDEEVNALLKPVSSGLKDAASVGVYDCSDACFPGGEAGNIYIFGYRVSEKKAPEVYDGALERKELMHYVFDTFDGMVAPIRSGTNIDMQRFLSQGEVAKIMLLTDKDEIPPILKAFSFFLRNKVPVGVVNTNDAETMASFQIQGNVNDKLPMMLAMTPVPVQDQPGQYQFQALFYSGKFRISQMLRFGRQFIREEDRDEDDEDKPSKSTGTSRGAKDVKVEEVVDQESFEAHCPSSSRLCLVAFLNGGESSKEVTQGYVQVLKDVLARKRATISNVMWVDGVCHHGFAGAFDIDEMKMPTAVVYLPGRQRYANLVGTLTEANLVDLIDGVLSGRIGSRDTVGDAVKVDEQNCEEIHALAAGTQVDEDEDADSIMAEILREEEERRRKEEEEEAEKKASKKKGKKGGKKKKKGKKSDL
uniref:Thioredoxin domain-containing protein n=1 Tax=Palpitomonas bilix TaxID=652834 RepID=A0A7S3GFG6_9EUKA|mmetsp:Transcript_47180/g.121951  ORF Transcript_47180/g.121951 Transcript_47180/m.121951 type:complete len:471 (+) Transcript_47180:121-1533(+)